MGFGYGIGHSPKAGAAVADFTVKKEAVYETIDYWTEESGGTADNSAEWSSGNGATGYIGRPIGPGWEVIGLYFHADTYAAQASITVDLMNYGNTPSNAAANTIASISLADATDGGGQTNNAYKLFLLNTPVEVPVTGDSTVIGFLTRNSQGNISDARVGARLRRLVGNYVCDVIIGGDAVQEDTGGGGNTGGAPALGAPNDGTLFNDNYQGGQSVSTPFNVQVRNNSGNPVNWQIVLTGTGFNGDDDGNSPLFPIGANVSSDGKNYDYAVVAESDGTFTHYFTGVNPLSAWDNAEIIGGVPDVSGAQGVVNLYIP